MKLCFFSFSMLGWVSVQTRRNKLLGVCRAAVSALDGARVEVGGYCLGAAGTCGIRARCGLVESYLDRGVPVGCVGHRFIECIVFGCETKRDF